MGKYSDNFLAEKRLKGDLLADEAITSLFTNANAASFSELLKNDWKNNDPLPKQLPKKLNTFFQKTQILPAWADNKKMKKATKFFANYSGDVMGLLGSLALPYCYAAADGAKVLYFSERIKKDTTKRLAETGQFVIDVLSPDAFEPEGKAIRSIQKVRLIHAAIRYHILKSGKWNKAWGYPINQEDMAGTNLAFSFIILRGLRKSGRIINSQEAEAYQHLWNVIGYILGLDEEIIPSNLKKAYLLTQAIEIRQMKPSFEGKALTKALLNNYEDQLPIKLPEGYITSYMRYLIGDEKADILDLPPTNWTSNLIKVQKLSNTLGQYISVLLNKQAGRKFDMQQIAAEKPKMSIPQKLGVD